MKILVTMFVAFISVNANALTLSCSIEEGMAWKQFEISGAGTDQISLKITKTNEMREADLGSVAILENVKAVTIHGRQFNHFYGTFMNGKPQKTISVWLSQDHKTLTRIYEGKNYNYTCVKY